MARHYMQAIAEPTVAPETPASWTPPPPTVSEDGKSITEWKWCERHREWFICISFPRTGFNGSTQCDTCKRDEGIQREAQAILRTRKDALRLRVEQKLAATEKERQQRVDVQLQRLAEAERPRIEEDVRWQDGQGFARDIEAEELAAIVAEMKATA